MTTRTNQRTKRRRRIQATIRGTESRPRLVVFRSHQHVYAQLINDETNRVLASASDIELGKGTKAGAVGKSLAEKAVALHISKAVFDRAGYKYHGNIKALAEGAREGGLEF